MPPRFLENYKICTNRYTFLDKQVSEEKFKNDHTMSMSLYMYKEKYNLFIEIIRSLLKSSVTCATPEIAKRTMHI